MPKYLALFRAINVGTRHRVKMADLKELHEQLGWRNVTAYLQTGNIIFESDDPTSPDLAQRIASEFKRKFGFVAEVMVRSLAELKEICAQNPFLQDPHREAKWIVVMFLAAAPAPGAVHKLMDSYSGPEEIVVPPGGKELYIYYTNDIGHSKLTNALIEKYIQVPGTGRNWNTVVKLAEILEP